MNTKLIQWFFRNNIDSWIRSLATLIGGWLASNSIPTGNIYEALTGAILLSFGFLTMWIDAADPSGQASKWFHVLIGGKEKDVAGALARKLILVLFAALNGLGFRFDETALASGDLITLITMILGFLAERALKLIPLALKR
jgi:hypothetical protein